MVSPKRLVTVYHVHFCYKNIVFVYGLSFFGTLLQVKVNWVHYMYIVCVNCLTCYINSCCLLVFATFGCLI